MISSAASHRTAPGLHSRNSARHRFESEAESGAVSHLRCRLFHRHFSFRVHETHTECRCNTCGRGWSR